MALGLATLASAAFSISIASDALAGARAAPASGELLARSSPWTDPSALTRNAAVLAVGAGVAASFLLARRLGASLGAAVGATLLAGSAAVPWIASAVPELHALHFGCVALTAFVASRAPHRRATPALALYGGLAVLLVPTCRGALVLAPGLALLLLWGRTRGGPLTPRGALGTLAFGAAACVAGLLVALAVGGPSAPLDAVSAGSALPALVLLPLAVAGLAARRDDARFVLPLGALVGPLALLLAWPGASHPAALTTLLPFAAASAAAALDRWPRAVVPLATAAAVMQVGVVAA
ncbi:MAG: hypothetical protein AAF682_07185 [Planctomycetota bacterium]